MRLSPDMTEDVPDGRPERGRAFSGLLLTWVLVMLAQLLFLLIKLLECSLYSSVGEWIIFSAQKYFLVCKNVTSHIWLLVYLNTEWHFLYINKKL